MPKILFSEILRKKAAELVKAEVAYPSQNIPEYQDETTGPEDNAGGAYGLSEPYLEVLTAPGHSDNKKEPEWYTNQGERPENDADFYTEPYASKDVLSDKTKKLKKLLMEGVPSPTNTSSPYTNGESPKDGYKGPGRHEIFTHPQDDPNSEELYPDTQQGGDLQLN